jgi:hypothetical protein
VRRTILALFVCILCPFTFGQAKAKRTVAPKPARVAQPVVNKQAVAILQQAASLIAQIPVPQKEYDSQRVHLLNDLGEQQWRAGDLAGARKSFDEALVQAKLQELKLDPLAKQGGSEIVQSVAFAHAEVADAAGVQLLLPLFSDVTGDYDETPRRSEVLEKLAEAQAKAGDMKAATATAAKIENEFKRAYAVMDIMQAHVRRGDTPSAQAIFDKLAPANKDFGTYLFVNALVDAGKFPEAIAMASTLRTPKKMEASDWFAPFDARGAAQGSIATAQADAGDIAGALLTIATMPDDDDKFRSLSALLKAQRKAGDTAGAERSYSQALASRSKYDSENHGLDTSHYAQAGSTLALLQGRAGKWAEARKTAQDGVSAKDSLFGAFSLDGLVEAYVEAKDYAGALQAAAIARKQDRSRMLYMIARPQAADAGEATVLAWVSDEATPELKATALMAVAQGVLQRSKGKVTEQSPKAH